MATTKLKEELYKFISEGDEEFVKTIYEIATAYISKTENDRMILESEVDIKEGRIYTQRQVQEMIENWKE